MASAEVANVIQRSLANPLPTRNKWEDRRERGKLDSRARAHGEPDTCVKGKRWVERGKLRGIAIAVQGFDVTGDLRSMCPALTLQQLYRLTEYQHDDWITGGQNSDTMRLLEIIKGLIDGYHVPVTPCILFRSF